MASVNFYLKGAISEKHIEELRNSEDTESLNELLTDPLQKFLKLSTQVEKPVALITFGRSKLTTLAGVKCLLLSYVC